MGGSWELLRWDNFGLNVTQLRSIHFGSVLATNSSGANMYVQEIREIDNSSAVDAFRGRTDFTTLEF
jgi:hypothetical protein